MQIFANEFDKKVCQYIELHASGENTVENIENLKVNTKIIV